VYVEPVCGRKYGTMHVREVGVGGCVCCSSVAALFGLCVYGCWVGVYTAYIHMYIYVIKRVYVEDSLGIVVDF
jgi:hypothetical protein